MKLFSTEYALEESFSSLDRWEIFTFHSIKEHSEFTVTEENGVTALKAVSQNSASGLLLKETFNIYETPVVRWRWKVKNLEKEKSADKEGVYDYPLRVYVLFQYNPENSPFLKRVKYKAIKLLYGKYPPHSSLCYTLAEESSDGYKKSPLSDDIILIPLDAGKRDSWKEHSVHITREYRRIFKEDPPSTASLGILSDSDTLGGSSESYIDYIYVEKEGSYSP